MERGRINRGPVVVVETIPWIRAVPTILHRLGYAARLQRYQPEAKECLDRHDRYHSTVRNGRIGVAHHIDVCMCIYHVRRT